MKKVFYQEIQVWMHRNARELDLCLWNYFFENGSKESVLLALQYYQNEDGGFGHALEADSWNPYSTPATTQHALHILKQIEFFDMEHPIYQGIWKYLRSEQDLLEYGWRFTIPTNNNYPHAPWWNYSEETNKKEYFGVTAEFAAFILLYGKNEKSLYQKAIQLTNKFLSMLLSDMDFGDMGLNGFITLMDAVKKADFNQYDGDMLTNELADRVKKAIEKDIANWEYYGCCPSDFIRSPNSLFYKDNEKAVKKEIQYLMDTKPKNDVWGITWTWFDNMEKYAKEFSISENWWKGYKTIEKMRFLRNFDDLEEITTFQ